jgi:hypothetical protein
MSRSFAARQTDSGEDYVAPGVAGKILESQGKPVSYPDAYALVVSEVRVAADRLDLIEAIPLG